MGRPWRLCRIAVVVFAVAASGCGGKTVAVTVTAVAKPAPAPTFEQLVAQVRSGVIRIETVTCDGGTVGTGVVVGPTLVATVDHVVEGATSIALKRNGVVVGYGTVIGADPARDVALVRSDRPISGYRFRFARRAPQLGEGVAAIGFPLALPLTVTRGSVSGLDRTIPIDGIQRARLVQTDAAVNPGNSGGPLISDAGAVVGLVDLGTNAANGLAFAVSADVAGPLIHSWAAAPQPLPAADCSGTQTGAAAAPAPAPTTTSSGYLTYTGTDFSIDYPADWIVSAAEVNKGTYLDTTLNPSGDTTLMIRVDENPNGHSGTVDAAAAPVINELRKDPTYNEISISHETFLGMPALRWEFTNTENGVPMHKIDEFLIDTNTGREWGILVQAPQSFWGQDAQPLEAYLQSFVPS